MTRIALAFVVLATLAGCTSTGTMWGTRNVSMWDRATPGTASSVHAPSISD